MEQKLGYCRKCGRARTDSRLSHRGLCPDCGRDLLLDAISQMRRKSGCIYERWARNYIASMQATVEKLQKELSEHD